ncbi:MAG: glycosyltransferase [Gammaproteobacteria bacterium]|nr:glycosyltransferase [Gammaproteobacteria bacterium]
MDNHNSKRNLKPLISIVAPTYNEKENIEELYERIIKVVSSIESYRFEIIIIDNDSRDGTQDLLRKIASQDKNFKVILNNRNFGHIRSPYFGILQSKGDAVIYLASDLQNPPELIPDIIARWEKGFKLVMAVKPESEGSIVFNFFRRNYYKILDHISDIQVIRDSTGFGLYDADVISDLKKIKEPYPFMRGLICDLGYDFDTIPFIQPSRKRGITKNNFSTLYDIGMLGIISHSKFPIRFCAFLGFLIGAVSFLIGVIYLILKIIFWASFPVGIAPLIIGLFFFIGLQFIFIGVIGEYIGSIHTYSQNRPLVVVKEKINF